MFIILNLNYQLLQGWFVFQMITYVFEFIVSYEQITHAVLLLMKVPNLERVQINDKKRSNLELCSFYRNTAKPLMRYMMTSLRWAHPVISDPVWKTNVSLVYKSEEESAAAKRTSRKANFCCFSSSLLFSQ